MSNTVEIILNKQRKSDCIGILAKNIRDLFNPVRIAAAQKFFASLGHVQTPLVKLQCPGLDKDRNAIWLKDESRFLGLGAFKGRGAIWAMVNILASIYGLSSDNAPDLKAGLASLPPKLFVTATDGNHGRAVAWAAKYFGQRAHILMPMGSAPEIVRQIVDFGAECRVLDVNYDETVRAAQKFAKDHNGILLQDTALSGYEEYPGLIMQGYGTMARECLDQLGDCWPEYILLQAGVGSFAASLMSVFILESEAKKLTRPRFISLEPQNAACVFKSIRANDGQSHIVTGDLATVMNGLSCGEVSTLAWPVLRDNLYAACACNDKLARLGMRLLGEQNIDSGPSGAIGAGFIEYIANNPGYAEMIAPDSQILLVSTEIGSQSQ